MRPLRTCFFTLFMALIGLVACSNETSWESFKSVPATLGSQTIPLGSILIPAKIDGIGWTWLQLDFGADRTVLYGGTVAKYHVPVGADGRLHGSLGAREESFDGIVSGTIDGGTVDGHPIVGTLGADFFVTHALALDLVHDRYALAPTVARLPHEVSDVTFVPMRYESTALYRNKLVISARAGTNRLERVLFDTGSSPFALVVNARAWPRITGRSLGDKRNLIVHANQFGAPVTLVGAPGTGSLQVGSASLDSPMVFAVTAGAGASAIVEPFDGVTGNALFARRYVLVVDVPAARLGMKAIAP